MNSVRRSLCFMFFLLCAAPAAALGASSATLAPDGATFLVSSDVGSERWAIALRRVEGNPRTINLTGTIFRSKNGGPASFVACQVRNDVPDLLDDPARLITLDCKGTGGCTADATSCAQGSWVDLGEVQVPASFFLPDAGLGSTASVSFATTEGDVGVDVPSSMWGQVMNYLAGKLRRLSAWTPRLTSEAQAQSDDRGATLSWDGFTYLVTKDVNGQRWSIGLNLDASQEDIVSVTGNVYPTDGGEPSFLYCTLPAGSKAKLSDLRSLLNLSCRSAGPCEQSARTCAARDWQPVDSVSLESAFFLPPLGVPALAPSDSGLIGIGTPKDPASQKIGVPLGQGAQLVDATSTSSPGSAAAEQACPVGRGCVVSQLGVCGPTNGEVRRDGAECVCVVDATPECVGCGTNQCGAACDFAAGDLTARGVCLPAGSTVDDCTCLAVEAEEKEPRVSTCGGPLSATCSGAGTCCGDDPRDGCSAESGGTSCAGLCLDPGSCDPSKQDCGTCAQSAQPQPVCGNGVVEGDEECDGSTVPVDCASLGFDGGTVRCSRSCRIDSTGCQNATLEGPKCDDYLNSGDFDSDGYLAACQEFCTSIGGYGGGYTCFFGRTGVGCVCAGDDAVCGDGRVSASEYCDASTGSPFPYGLGFGLDDARELCRESCPAGSVAGVDLSACTGTCEPVCTECVPSGCGNGVPEPPTEQCDGPGNSCFDPDTTSIGTCDSSCDCRPQGSASRAFLIPQADSLVP